MNEDKYQADPLVLLSDEPIKDLANDGLELGNWARVAAGVALGTQGPFTIGVFSQWGTGKTSILQLARIMVDNSEEAKNGKITTVAFNAWQYEHESFPVIPLVASILSGLSENKSVSSKLRAGKQSLHNALRSVLFGLSIKGTAKASLLGEIALEVDGSKTIDRYEELRSKWIDQQIEQSLYYNAFKTLHDAQSEQNAGSLHRVVVFIDDLDRCFPTKAIQLLENIKLILNQPGFIFVLAVDRHILESYLDKRYADEFGLKEYHQGQSYLDKIIQLPLWIPPHEKRFPGLVEKLLRQPALESHRDCLEPLMKIISLACEHNPRQLIRFFNDLLVDNYVYQIINPGQQVPFGAFIIARGLRHQSEYIYQGLVRDDSLCDRMKSCEDENELKHLLTELVAQPDLIEMKRDDLRRLQGRSSLLRLLTSDTGKEWLSNSELRARVDNFLSEERQVDQTIQELLERALKQIESDEEDNILVGLQILWALDDDSLRLKALPRIVELMYNSNQRVSRQAKATMERLSHPKGV